MSIVYILNPTLKVLPSGKDLGWALGLKKTYKANTPYRFFKNRKNNFD